MHERIKALTYALKLIGSQFVAWADHTIDTRRVEPEGGNGDSSHCAVIAELVRLLV